MVGAYVLLPAHLNLLYAPERRDAENVRRWVKFWKRRASCRWPGRDERPLWQVQAWDRQLRLGEAFSAKWAYVRMNPMRHGLVSDPDAWPRAGVVHGVRW